MKTIVAGATIGILLLIIILIIIIVVVVCALKLRSKRKFQSPTKVETNDLYGTYDITGEMSDYSTVEDTNNYYGE